MRNLGLDIVRFFALLLVLIHHVNPNTISNPILIALQRGGWVGVDLFFVLSGFLISSLFFYEYKRTGDVNIKRFLIRRAFKIYPAFWVLIFCSSFALARAGKPPSFNNLINELLFIQNYRPGVWGHTWSLAVEEHFYVGFALLIVVLRKYHSNKLFDAIPKCYMVVAFTCLLWRYFKITSAETYNYSHFAFLTHLRMDSLFFGVFLCYLVHFQGLKDRLEKIPGVILTTLGGFLLLPAFVFALETHRWIFIWGVSLFYLGSGFLVLGAIKLKSSKYLFLKFLGGIGTASYSIYLWHILCNLWGLSLLRKMIQPSSPIMEIGFYILGSLTVGWVMNRLIELPALRLRDSFFADLSKIKSELSPS